MEMKGKMVKKMTAFLLMLAVVLTSIGINPIGVMASEGNKLSYDVSLEVKDADKYKITTTGDVANLNDGNLASYFQPVYQSKVGEDVYKEIGLLRDSFYIILDLGQEENLSEIAICWYPTGNRAYKYIVELSTDGTEWTAAADHSDNTTEKNTISDDLTGKSARYIRIEVMGNYRASDNTSSAYFPTNEITVKGVAQSEPSEEENISYTVSLEVTDPSAYKIVTTGDPAALNDGDAKTYFQPVYQSVAGGDVYQQTGVLKAPFYMILDLQKEYDLESIDISWYPAGGRAYKYAVEVSSDGADWASVADHSLNTTEKDGFADDLTGSTARYIRIVIFGNYRESDNSHSAYFPTTEITVKGKVHENNIPTGDATDFSLFVLLTIACFTVLVAKKNGKVWRTRNEKI